MILHSKNNCLKYFDKTHCGNTIFEVFYQSNHKTDDETESPLSNLNTPTSRLLPSEKPKRTYYEGQKNHF